MLDKLTITNENLGQDLKFKGRKPAKLSTYQRFYNNAKKEMTKLKVIEGGLSQEKNTSTQPTDGKISNIGSSTNLANNNVFEKKIEVQQDTKGDNQLNSTSIEQQFLSVEEYNKRLDTLNAVCFKDLPGNIKSTGARKLRVAQKVKDVCCHVRNYVAKVYQIIPEAKEEQPKNETFDFGKSLNNMQSKEPEVTKQSDNNIVKLDEWLLNKDTNVSNVAENSKVAPENDSNAIIEFQNLVEQKTTTEDSLATQKEILANLRKKVQHNKALCEAKKQELIEENMALTQELNDVLAEINELTDLANEQEAFLNMSRRAS